MSTTSVPTTKRLVQQRPVAHADDSVSAASPPGARRSPASRWWSSFDAAPTARQIPGTGIIALLAAMVGLAACIWTTSNGSNLYYSDAQSHLTIARRIVDSATPGLDQLGTVWLPMPHLLLVPFSLITPLWSSGWSACLVDIGCLAVAASALYRIAARIGLGRAGRLTAVIALLANPSLLYTFTTALTEPVLIAGILATVAGLARWATVARTPSGGELAVFAGLPAMVAMMSRYEGWALVLAGTVFVLVVEVRKGHGLRRGASRAACFLSVPALSAIWWFSYNWVSYGDPLEFAHGQYSAHAQQQVLLDNGLLPTKGQLAVSISSYNWALIETAGAVLLIAALFGLVVLLRRERVSTATMLTALLAVSYFFSIISLYLGQTAINNDHTNPPNWWNDRFALSVCPLLALLVGVLADRRGRRPVRWAVPAVILVAIIGQNIWWAQDLPGRSAIIAEAARSHRDTAGAVQAAEFLSDHYSGGSVLLDESARGNEILPVLGIPLQQVIMRASGAPFAQAVADPAAHAEWIFANIAGKGVGLDSGPSDLLTAALARPSIAAHYRLVFAAADHAVYQRIGTS